MSHTEPIAEDTPPIRDARDLDERLSRPSEAVVETFRRLTGDLAVLGVGGKMGPKLIRMAKRASDRAGTPRRVIGISTFSDPELAPALQADGIETIRADLLDPAQVAALPEVPLVVYMTGMKFGSTGREAKTWAINTFVPGRVAERFRGSRIAAFSTGNVYGLTPVAKGGSVEDDPPAPVGEYAMSCLGRERIFEHFSRSLELPMTMLRLNYAAELRYGVLLDIAQAVDAEQPVDVSMGHVNVIWEAEANAMALRSLEQTAVPPRNINIAGAEIVRIRDVAERFARLLDKPVWIEGTERDDALLNNGGLARELFGPPAVSTGRMIRWVADWLRRGGETLGKPTRFQNREGKF